MPLARCRGADNDDDGIMLVTMKSEIMLLMLMMMTIMTKIMMDEEDEADDGGDGAANDDDGGAGDDNDDKDGGDCSPTLAPNFESLNLRIGAVRPPSLSPHASTPSPPDHRRLALFGGLSSGGQNRRSKLIGP